MRRDTCDTKLTNANPAAPSLSERQRRFLEAYRVDPVILRAARLARLHRATVYRWMADPAFVAAMEAAAEVFYEAHRAKVDAENAARQKWREDRERARKSMRCENLERARGYYAPSDTQ